MSFMDKIKATVGDRSGDARRQVRSGSSEFKNPLDDPWSQESIAADNAREKARQSTPEYKAAQAKRDISNRMSSEAAAHEKRTGLPATFLPNVSRIAPEGMRQVDHDRDLQKSHERSQASQSGILHVDGRPSSSSLPSGTNYDLWEHPGANASTHHPRNSLTITSPKIVHLPHSDGFGTTPHLEYSLAAGGFGSRHRKPLSEIHGLETSRSENQPQRSGASDQSNEWWRN